MWGRWDGTCFVLKAGHGGLHQFLHIIFVLFGRAQRLKDRLAHTGVGGHMHMRVQALTLTRGSSRACRPWNLGLASSFGMALTTVATPACCSHTSRQWLAASTT